MELKHWGIKGMHWGERRYQNKDGSLTPEGLKRYDREKANNLKAKKDKRIPEEGLKDPSRWVKEDRERTKSVADAGKRLNDDLRQANRNAMNRAAKKRSTMDLSHMSDKEMRDQINRAMLERQYNDMFAPKNESKGREYADSIFEGVGSALAITSSALSIALAINQLKKG